MTQARKVYSQSQAKITYLSCSVSTKIHIARLYVPVDNPFAVSIIQAPADGLGDTNCLLDGEAVLRGFLNQDFDVTARHERHNDVGLSFMFPHVVDGNDVGMVAEPAHRSGFAGEAHSSGIVQFLGLDEGKRYFTFKLCIMDKVHLLNAALAQQLLNLVTAICKGGRQW
jgi:hypothetical protein